MSNILNRDEVLRKFGGKPWISPYQRIIGMFDPRSKLIEVHEFHARGVCIGGSAWETYHYPRVSPLVLNAKREGARNIFIIREGQCKLSLIPGIAGAGVEKAEGKENQIQITYAGLAGGGIAATVCRGMAEGVTGVRIYETGGGNQLGRATLILPEMRKIIFGVDDTDEPGAGATWGFVNEISYALDRERYGVYLNHTIVQLYTKNPYKTTNCVSIATTFAVQPGKENVLIEEFKKRLKKDSYSKQTGMAIFKGIMPSETIRKYGERAKIELLTVEDVKKVAVKNDVELISITGERGLIGAVAAISFANDPDEAVKIYEKI